MADNSGTPEGDLDLLDDLLKRAKKAGADAADTLMYESIALEASCRLGAREDMERSEARDLGLRVFTGKSQAIVSSNDFSSKALDEMASRAVAISRAAPEDPYCGLADPSRLAKDIPDLDLFDPSEPDAEQLYTSALACEAAAREVAGVTNSEGGGAAWGRVRIALATSDGFAAGYASSSHSLYASVLAGEGTAMERDYDMSSAHHLAELKSADKIGLEAGQRAVRRLNPQKVETGAYPVVFEPRASRSLIGHFAGAISGAAVARGTSFLKDKMGQQIFPAGTVIVDDPHRRRGLSSKPFDGEGVANQARNLVDDGRITTWLLDSASARQLGLETTGNATRGIGGPPSPSATNVHLQPGEQSLEQLIADIKAGLLVTELIGMGVNYITGDYSRGASGYWIENGKISHPVSELTIAGNLVDMFAQMTPANDLEFHYGTNAPSLRLESMTVAGA